MIFFATHVAPIILAICGGFLIYAGIRWFRFGHPFKGLFDLIGAFCMFLVAFYLPSIVP